jgi:hypothetical protein
MMQGVVEIEAKVSSIIRNGDWFWPCARLDNLVEIQSRCNDPPPMTQYCMLLALQTILPRRSPILGLLSQKHA